MNATWNPWKATAIAMALVMAIALVTGLVVANRVGNDTNEIRGAFGTLIRRPMRTTGTGSSPR